MEGLKYCRSVNFIGVIMLMLAGVLFYACDSKGTDDRTAKNNTLSHEDERERSQLRDELNDLSDDIDRELEKVDRRLDRSSDETKEHLELANRKLLSNKAKVEKALDDIETSGQETWEDVRLASDRTAQDVKESFQKLAYDIDEIFDGNR